jgi:3-oxoacid CoA-transferase subunit B|tara:strand:- start:1907 stop:2578 length:672 start_codon:yes stop_codon:yes gene_type:complete
MKFPEKLNKDNIAFRASVELEENSYVNLGIGLPSLCAKYIDKKKNIRFQAENGVLGFDDLSQNNLQNPDYMDAGGQFLAQKPGMSFFDSAESFSMIRAGYIDVTILGGMQVSEDGDLANWMIKDRGIGSIGGAMDLVSGAKKVIVTMEHVTKENQYKILKYCNFPLTGKNCVNKIITDIAVIDVTFEGLVIKEIAPKWDFDMVQELTEPELIIKDIPKEYQVY